MFLDTRLNLVAVPGTALPQHGWVYKSLPLLPISCRSMTFSRPASGPLVPLAIMIARFVFESPD